MIKNIKKILFLLSAILFVILITKFYFSDENKNKVAKLRTIYLNELNNNLDQIPVLVNDTKNIIEYTSDLKKFKNKEIKRKFWELIDK